MTTAARILLAVAALVALPVHAGDAIDASPFATVVSDLLVAFHASETPCEDVSEADEVCFVVAAAGASYLAERLEEVAAGYDQAGLAIGEWRAANGVWAVRLTFGDARKGVIEVYLAEVRDAAVRGVIRYLPAAR